MITHFFANSIPAFNKSGEKKKKKRINHLNKNLLMLSNPQSMHQLQLWLFKNVEEKFVKEKEKKKRIKRK